MLKKMFLGALMLAGVAAFAGERAGLYLQVIGDATAKIEFTSESEAVDCDANTYSRNKDRNEVMRCCWIAIEDEKPVEVEIEVTSSVSGKGAILCRGFAEDSNAFAWVNCTKLEVDGKVVLPSKRFSNGRDVYHHTQLMRGIKVEADKPIKIKATFVHSKNNKDE